MTPDDLADADVIRVERVVEDHHCEHGFERGVVVNRTEPADGHERVIYLTERSERDADLYPALVEVNVPASAVESVPQELQPAYRNKIISRLRDADDGESEATAEADEEEETADV